MVGGILSTGDFNDTGAWARLGRVLSLEQGTHISKELHLPWYITQKARQLLRFDKMLFALN